MKVLHDFKHGDRWAQVYKVGSDFVVQCFTNQIYDGSRTITGHSEQYAEDCAENYVFGLWSFEHD